MSEQAAEVNVSLGLSAAKPLERRIPCVPRTTECTFSPQGFSYPSRLFTRSSASVFFQSKSVALKCHTKDCEVDSVTRFPQGSYCVFELYSLKNSNVETYYSNKLIFAEFLFHC